MKALRIIFGILSLMLAMFCLTYPFAAQLTCVYIFAIYIGIVGIITVIDYIAKKNERKKSGVEAAAGGISLAAAIISIIFMICNITISGFTFATAEFGAMLLLLAIVIDGFMNIVGAFTYRDYSLGMRILVIILGILMISAGSTGFFITPLIVSMFGIFTAIGIGVFGVSLIATSFSEN